MVLFVLAAIHLLQKQNLPTAAIMLGIAINIKGGAILLVPGFLLVIAFERGLIRSLLTLVIVLMVQIFIGLEFLLVNPKAYLNMSYNFERQFVKRE